MQQRVNAIHFSADFGIFDWMVATNEAASHRSPARRFLKARCNVKRMATELLIPK